MSSSPPHPTPPHPTHPTPPEAVHCVALWTRITLCFGHVSSMTQKSEKTMHFWEKIKRVSQLWQRQKHCSQWYECWVWVLGHTCCRNPVKRCLICPKTCVSYGEYMMKNARDQAPGRNNKVHPCKDMFYQNRSATFFTGLGSQTFNFCYTHSTHKNTYISI